MGCCHKITLFICGVVVSCHFNVKFIFIFIYKFENKNYKPLLYSGYCEMIK